MTHQNGFLKRACLSSHCILSPVLVSAETKTLLFVFAEEPLNGLVSHGSQLLIQSRLFLWVLCILAGLLLVLSLIWFPDVSSGASDRLLNSLSLRKLLAGNNHLQRVPDLLDHIPLEVLDLQHNRLVELSESLFYKALK